MLAMGLVMAVACAVVGEGEELALADALAELERQNLTAAQARARADEAAAAERQALAPLLPALTATGALVRNSDEARLAAPGRTVVIQPGSQLTGALSLRVPLVAPQAWFDADAARRGARAAGESARAVRLAVRAGFVQAAHAARAAEEVVVASEVAVASAAELARSAERRVAAGTAAPLDRLRAQAELVRRESDLARARADLDRARLALGVLLGRAEPVRVLVPEEPAPEAPADPAAAAEQALRARPEVAARAREIEAAEAQRRSAAARFLPQLAATGTAFASDQPAATGEKDGWRAAVELSWPLYDGGLRYGKRDEAAARLAGARAAADAQALAVRQEVHDAARDVAVARERLRLARAQRDLAADAAGTAKRSFDAGLASSLDVLDANDRRYAADVGLAEARARLATAGAALARALGRDP